jgi:hypothetical protein
MRMVMAKKQKTKDDNQEQSNQTLTPDQQAIFNRVEAETAEWETIREDQIEDYSLSISPLDLKHNFPEAWEKQNNRLFAFRWCERTEKRVDELTRGGHPVTRWKICTRVTTPFLSKYIDKMLGCVSRLDQILLFRPWERHMIEKNAKNRLLEAHANSGKPENMALKRATEKIEAYSGPEHKIDSRDEVTYEDIREDIGDLVVEE